jgi:hypothetical protein
MRIIITESQLKNLNLEQFDNFKMPSAQSDYLGRGGQFEKTNKLYNPFEYPISKGPKKNTTIDDAMESFREGLFSPTGMAIESFLTSFAFTAPGVVAAYAAMLAYDIYKSLNGETDWFNIIVDTLCVATSGVVSGVFAPLVKGGKKGFSSISKVFEWLKTTSVWTKIKPYLSNLSSGINVVGSWIAKGLKWIADNTGITVLAKWSSKIVSFFSGITNGILEVIGQISGKVATKLTGSVKVGQATSNAAKVGIGQKVVNKGIESGVKEPQGKTTQIKPSQSSIETATSIKFD